MIGFRKVQLAMNDAGELERQDAEARERALDPARSILLQAPAGSGKTTVLTQRFLRLLAEVDEPEEILAITFTRKAAGEMRERVFRALRSEGEDDSAHGKRMRELAQTARARSQARGWSLEVNPGRLRIQTIDSLNRWLAQHLPVTARAIGDLAVTERPASLYRLAARRALLDADDDEQLQGDVERLFERLDNDFGRFERLLTTMLGARSHWLPRLLQNQEPGLCARVEASLQAIAEERLRAATAVIPASLIERGVDIARRAAARRESEDGVTCEGAFQGDKLGVAHWQALSSLALTDQGTWRRSLTKREGFPTDDKPAKEQAQEWIADLSAVSGARELLLELSELPMAHLPAADAQALESLSRLLALAASELEVVFQEAGLVDYPYIAGAARRALTEEGAPTDLGIRLGVELRHILVDEFQDTSIDQYELLHALTAGWDAGDGRTLFIVGDPMQSIYQFREAEVGLFLRTRAHGIGQLRLEALTLTRNFRSLPQLTAWTNSSFARVFPAFDDPRASAVRYLPCVASRAGTGQQSGLIQLHRVHPGDVEGEARNIAELVARMRAREPAASVAVLVCARTHAGPIATALEAAKIPVAGVDLVSLAELSVVRDLTALARALDHLGDRTAWLAALRAPWCGLTLLELSALLERSTHATIWETMSDGSRLERLHPVPRARLLRARDVLAHALADRDRLEPARWVERTWLRLGGPAACASAADLDHARAFFDAFEQWSTGPDWVGPLGLEEQLAGLYAVHEGVPANAVQIMTIHRAKGLEFDKVIVPGLGRRLRGTAEPLLRWLELPRDPQGSDLLLAPIGSSDRRAPEPLNEYLKSLQSRRAANERSRLMYVAATRARSELHLYGELPAEDESKSDSPRPRTGTLLATLWPAIAADFPSEPDSPAPPMENQKSRVMPLQRLPADWRLPEIAPAPSPVELLVATYEPEEAESTGAVDITRCVHQLVREQFRRFTRQGALPSRGQVAAGHRALRERLARLGLGDDELADALERTVNALESCVADSRARWIFAPTHQQIASPLELTGLHEGRLASVAIDRSFVDAHGVRWVIDFDPGAPENGEDTAQFLARAAERRHAELERYIAFAQTLGPEPVRAALYFPTVCAYYELPRTR